MCVTAAILIALKWKDILFQGEFMSYKSNSVLKGIPTFQGDKYYRFDPEERPPVKRSYPKPVENWEGIPGHIDDALQYKIAKLLL